MTRLLAALAASVLAASAGGCGNSSLSGSWTWNGNTGGISSNYALELDNGGGATVKVTVPAASSAMCSGTITTTGLNWSTSSLSSGIEQTPESTIGISGPGNCSGTITCMVGGQSSTLGCADVQTETFNYGGCPYTLSTDGNTLAVRCPEVPGGFVYSRPNQSHDS